MEAKNQILTNLDAQICEIMATVDLEELLKKVKGLKVLKTALDEANIFHENAVKFARLEAAALIRVAELGGVKELHGHRRNAAEWLANMDEDSRDGYIAMCEEGLTIAQVWKREVKDKKDEALAMEMIEYEIDMAVTELKEHAITDLTDLDRTLSWSGLSDRICNSIMDGARNRLRTAGGVGVGDGKGTYVIPCGKDEENARLIGGAVKVRIQSILHDLENLKRLCQNAEYMGETTVFLNAVEGNKSELYQWGIGYPLWTKSLYSVLEKMGIFEPSKIEKYVFKFEPEE